MKLKNLFKDERGLVDAVEIIKALILIVVIGAVGVFIADQVVTTTNLQATDVSASGTYNFTGAGVTGQYVNITNATGATMCYQVNTTGAGKDIGCLVLNVAAGNNATALATELRAQLQADGDINGSITVTNTSSTNAIVTWNTAGTVGNSIATTDTVTNGSWSAATLTGGLDASLVAPMQTNVLETGETGSSFLVILVIAFIGGIAISYLSFFGSSKK